MPAEGFGILRVTTEGNLYYRSDASPPPPVAQGSLEPGQSTAQSVAEAVTAAAVPIESPPVRHSRAGSTNVLCLEFDGHSVTGTN